MGLSEVLDQRMSGIADLVLDRAAPRKDESVLEIGCGTGSSAVPLATRVGGRGTVLGVDISEAMLSAARQRIAASGLANVFLLCADAQTHGFTPGHFDLLFSRFGVMFFDDPVAAFRNIRRAGRPGARLCFVCWGPLEGNVHWLLPLEAVTGRLGPAEPKPPHAPGPLAFSDPDYLRGVLESSGFRDISITREMPHVLGSTPEAEAEFACKMGPAGSLIAERGPEAGILQEIMREIAAGFSRYASNGRVVLPALVHLVQARVPQSEGAARPG